MTQRLPIAKIENGKVILTDYEDYEKWIECEPYGEMSDGTMVWENAEKKQFIRKRFYGKYFFINL